MNIKRAIREAIALAAGGTNRVGYQHHVHLMATSSKWSSL